MVISIFGLGYVGCVSLGCLAKSGHDVLGVEVSKTKIDLINQGKPTIIEKGIDEIISEQWRNKKISATNNACQAVINSDVSIICVGTPSTDHGHLNLFYIMETAEQIGEGIKDKTSFHVVIIRSTVLPGTNNKVSEIIQNKSGKKINVDFAVVSNPEFLREGSSVFDYYNPSHTVIGSDNPKAISIVKEIYKDINAPIEVVDIEVAEMIKYVNNSFHALKVTFANEVGNICKQLNIDSHKVMDLFTKDTKLNISSYYMKPGFAYGGSCLPKDLKGLVTIAHDNYLDTPVLGSIDQSNEYQKEIVFNMVVKTAKTKVGILGISFKKGTDDLRYSPVVDIAERLLGKGFELFIFDKNVNISRLTGTNKEYIDKHIPHLSKLIIADLSEVIKSSEVIIVTQKDKDFENLYEKIQDKIIIDLVRIFPEKSKGMYHGICW